MSRLIKTHYALACVVVAVSLLGCFVYWTGLIEGQRRTFAEVQARNAQRAAQLSDSVDQTVSHLVQGFDLAAKQLREAWVQGRLNFASTVRNVTGNYPPDAIKLILVFGADGYLAYSSDGSKQRLFFGDREHFRVHADSADDKLFISSPVVGRVGNEWVILLTRPIYDNGRFVGVIVMSLRPDYLNRIFSSLRQNDGDVVSVLRAEGQFLVRTKNPEDALGKSAPPERAFMQPDNHDRRGVQRIVSALDGKPLVLAWVRSVNWPLISLVGLDETTELATLADQAGEERTRAAVALTAVMVFAVIVAALLVFSGRQQRRLHESRNQAKTEAERYRLLLRMASDGIHILDRRGALKEVSQSFCNMLGYSEAEMAGMKASDWDVQFSAAELDIFFAAGLPPAPYTLRSRHRRRDGVIIDVELNLCGILIDGEPCVYASARDISQRIAMEAELQRSNAELEQFAYVVSHDLRQPLRAVTSYLGLLKRELGDNLSEDLQSFIGFAVGGAKRMDALILGLLEYSRVGRVEKPFSNAPLVEVMKDVLRGLSFDFAEIGGTITVMDDLPVVWGDYGELMRLFENLLNNAIKYRSPHRPLQVKVSWRDAGRDWIVSVEDNGAGIAAKDRERVFGIFQRLVANDQVEGTGIGLAVCRKIVEHHHGRIWVGAASADDDSAGSVFTMSFPKAEAFPKTE